MRFLQLTTAIVALAALPAVAVADNYMGKHQDQTHRYKQSDTYKTSAHYNKKNTDMYKRNTYTDGSAVPANTISTNDHENQYRSGTYKLLNGMTLEVNDTFAKFVNPDGSKYYAPSGEYITAQNQQFFIKDGEVTGFLYQPASAQGYIDADVDNDGVVFEREENNVRVYR